VRVPAVDFEHGDPRAIRPRQEFASGTGEGGEVVFALGRIAGEGDMGVAAFFHAFADGRAEQRVSPGERGDLGTEVRRGDGEPFGRPAGNLDGAAEKQWGADANRHGLSVGVAREFGQRGDNAVEPAAGHTVVGAGFHVVLGLEVAADAVWAGDGMHGQ
jgi:hypothetical protein